MRFSSSFSHTSSPVLDNTSSDDYSASATSLLNYPFTHPLDSYRDDLASQPKTLDLMSQGPFNFNDPALGLDFSAPDVDALAASEDFSSGPPHSQWPAFSFIPYQQQQQLNQHGHQSSAAFQFQGHRRAPSSSSYGGAPDSPYSHASSLQYPTAYPQGQQYLQPQHPQMWEGGYHSPSNVAQHLPTPSHTPKSDSQHMDAKTAPRHPSLPRVESSHASMRFVLSHQDVAQKIETNEDNRRANRSAGREAPLTPRTLSGDDFEAHGGQAAVGESELLDDIFSTSLFEDAASRHVPKFDRTMSDIYQDELYNPNSVTSAQPAPSSSGYAQSYLNPQQNLINQRLNEAHMGRAYMSDARQPSPFRPGSEFTGQVPYTSQQTTAMQHQAAARQEHARQQARRSEQQPQTVSPKDAFPEQPAPEEENMPSLFPASSNQSDMSASAYAPHQQQQYAGRQHYANMPPGSQAFPPTLPSMDTTKSSAPSSRDTSPERPHYERPVDTSSGSGTYTCTYHGCAERFQSPALLQKHKREAHRSTAGGPPPTQRSASPTSTTAQQQMTQAGPHECKRINPSTGKPCNTVFSRPYDLTRHEDTIHAERKKVRCPHCTDEKTFSRADALTRHLRVVHPHVSFPGKQRRRQLV